MKRFYISGALRGSKALSAAREKYEEFACLLTYMGYEAYLPHSQTDPEMDSDMEPSAVFLKDMGALSACDAVVAFLDEPSLGVGAEIALAIQQEKAVIGIFRRGNEVSRFIEGLIRVSENSLMVEYEGLQDAADSVIRKVEGLWLVGHRKQ
jgi:nucleoside 2-deoxyribosyltransferase